MSFPNEDKTLTGKDGLDISIAQANDQLTYVNQGWDFVEKTISDDEYFAMTSKSWWAIDEFSGEQLFPEWKKLVNLRYWDGTQWVRPTHYKFWDGAKWV